MEVDWDEIQNTYAEDTDVHFPEGNFNYIPQVPDVISTTGSTIIPDSSTPMLPKRHLERPDSIDHDRIVSLNRDIPQKPDIESADRDQAQNHNIDSADKNQAQKPDIESANRDQSEKPDIESAERDQTQKSDIESADRDQTQKPDIR